MSTTERPDEDFNRLIDEVLKAIEPVFLKHGLFDPAVIPAVAMALCERSGKLLLSIPEDDRVGAINRAIYHLVIGAQMQKRMCVEVYPLVTVETKQ